MTAITDHVIYDVLLLSDIPPTASFGINLAMMDEDSIPVDRRVLEVSPASYRDDLPAGSVALAYATTYFSQDIKADKLLLGRRIEADTAPVLLWGPGYGTDVAAWKAISDGKLAFLDSGANEAEIAGLDFSAVTALPQVFPVIQAALAALVAPDIVGLDDATVGFDALGRVAVFMPAAVAGADSPTIAFNAPTAGGTDLRTLVDATNAKSVSGFDTETIVESFDAIRVVNDVFYNVEAVRASDSDNLLLAAVIQSLKKQLTAVTKTAGCKDPTSTTDIMAVAKANGYDRTLVIFDALLDSQFVGAAVEGRLLPTEEGSTNWAFTTVSGVVSSDLSVTDRSTMKAKNGNYLETVGSSTYLYQGITSGNVEKRLILGIDWFEDRCQVDTFAALLNNPVLGFDNDTITIIFDILDRWSTEAIARKIFVNTKERPFVISLPDADDFTQLDRASHKMTIENAFTGYANSAVNDILVRGSVSI